MAKKLFIAAIDKNMDNIGQIAFVQRKTFQGSRPVDDVGCGDVDHVGQPIGVDADMPLDSRNQLAAIKALLLGSVRVFDALRVNDQKSGAFVPGIRPGDQTARYIDKILTRLTLAGAAYMVLVCLLPEFLVLRWNVPFYFGGTSLLIIVVVTMDFMAQVQSYMMQQQYESLLKKANFKMGNS